MSQKEKIGRINIGTILSDVIILTEDCVFLEEKKQVCVHWQ
jgi:hypothetical protein